MIILRRTSSTRQAFKALLIVRPNDVTAINGKATMMPIDHFSDPALTMTASIIADAWVRIPLMSAFILEAIASVPQSLYNAAEVDGADCVDSFFFVTLPNIKHMVLIGLFITSMISFRTIDVIFAMTGGGPGRVTQVLTILFELDSLKSLYY